MCCKCVQVQQLAAAAAAAAAAHHQHSVGEVTGVGVGEVWRPPIIAEPLPEADVWDYHPHHHPHHHTHKRYLVRSS